MNSIPNLSKTRVLILDDNATQAIGLSNKLSDYGFETDDVQNGSDFLERVASLDPHVCIMDIALGTEGTDKKGLDLVKFLRKLGNKCMIIIHSAYVIENEDDLGHLDVHVTTKAESPVALKLIINKMLNEQGAPENKIIEQQAKWRTTDLGMIITIDGFDINVKEVSFIIGDTGGFEGNSGANSCKIVFKDMTYKEICYKTVGKLSRMINEKFKENSKEQRECLVQFNRSIWVNLRFIDAFRACITLESEKTMKFTFSFMAKFGTSLSKRAKRCTPPSEEVEVFRKLYGLAVSNQY